MLCQQSRWNDIAHCLDRRLRYFLTSSSSCFGIYMKKHSCAIHYKTLAAEHNMNTIYLRVKVKVCKNNLQSFETVRKVGLVCSPPG